MMGFLKYTIPFCMLLNSQVEAQQKKTPVLNWDIAANLPNLDNHPNLGYAGPVTGMMNSHLLIAGGANFPEKMPWFGGQKKYYDQIYLYKRHSTGISLTPTQSRLPHPIAYAAICPSKNEIYYAGGENENGLSNLVFKISWQKEHQQIAFESLPNLPFALTNGSATCIDDKMYIVGGESKTGVSDKMLVLDLKHISLGWKEIAILPKPVSHSVVLSSKKNGSSMIFIMGGRKKTSSGVSDLYQSCWSYNINTGEIINLNSLPISLSASTGAIVQDNQLLIFGGDSGETFHQVETLIASINQTVDPIKKDSLLGIKNSLQIHHPGFNNQIFRYQINMDKWDVIGSIPFAVPVTTTAVKWDNQIFFPSGEIKAGIRSPYILVAKNLPN